MSRYLEAGISPASEGNFTEKKGTSDIHFKNDETEILAGEFEEIHQVKQGLHGRHIQMIALAGMLHTIHKKKRV